MIWKKAISLDELNDVPEYMGTFLGIKFTGWDDNTLTATMPVNKKTQQPRGILHGGASVVLAETIGSYASSLIIDTEKYYAVGLEVNANHLRPAAEGEVTGICEPLHIGRKTHVWSIKILNSEKKMVCVSRLTVAIIEKEK
jgi:1,4-dihydroxy-2-naphthoyl-CoA hydrolase